MTAAQTRRSARQDIAPAKRFDGSRWLLPARHQPSRGPLLWAMAAGVAVAGGIAVLRVAGALTGPFSLVLLFACVVALPTARTFSGRIALSLSVLLGLVPLLWWIPSGFGPFGRGTLVLASAAGMLVFSALRNGVPVAARRLVPSFRWLDTVPVLAAVLSSWVHWKLLTVHAYDKALSLLTMNWDNASHFDIFHMQRLYGRVVPLLGPSPDGSDWSFTDYPQGFHGVVAIIAELTFGKPVGSPAEELVNFANGSALVSVLVVVMVLAALASLPTFRRRSFVAFPALALVAAGWIFGPGSSASLYGFPNFFLAVGLASVALVLATTTDRPLSPAALLPFVACVVGVAHNWALLEVLVLGTVVMVLQPWDRLRWRETLPGYVSAALIVLVGVTGVALAVSQLAGVSTEAVLYGVGGVPIPDLGQLAAIVLGTSALAALTFAKATRNAGGALQRLRWSFAGLAGGLMLASVMAAAQLAKGGTLTYYSYKLAIALFLAGLVTLALVLAACLETFRGGSRQNESKDRAEVHGSIYRRGGGRKPGAVAASALAAVAATQAFGFTFPLAAQGLPPSSPSAVAMAKESKVLDKVPPSVILLMAATKDREGQPAVYVTTRPTDIDAILAKQWYDGLTSTYTEKGWKLSLNMFELSGGVDNLRLVVNKIKKADPSALIIVDPDNQAALNYVLATLDE